VLNLAPVPADRGRQRSSACKFVLVGLAEHCEPIGAAEGDVRLIALLSCRVRSEFYCGNRRAARNFPKARRSACSAAAVPSDGSSNTNT
jgi:hypothetical protein